MTNPFTWPAGFLKRTGQFHKNLLYFPYQQGAYPGLLFCHQKMQISTLFYWKISFGFVYPTFFIFFGYDTFSSHIIKVTRDAEIDIDNDVATSLIQKN